MNFNQPNSEYPEHLNPFHSKKSSLTRSFRGIKKAIIKPFVGKDKEKPVIRPKSVSAEQTRSTYPSSTVHKYVGPSPTVLPRSRFSERLTMSQTYAARESESGGALANKNPFEEKNAISSHAVDDSDINATTPPKPIQRSKLKKRKKIRAPIPPESVIAGDEHLPTSASGSKWSLVSTESDMSSVGYSEGELDYSVDADLKQKDTGKADEILEITREIARFAEDANNNNIIPNKVTDNVEQLNNTDKSKCNDSLDACDARPFDTKSNTMDDIENNPLKTSDLTSNNSIHDSNQNDVTDAMVQRNSSCINNENLNEHLSHEATAPTDNISTDIPEISVQQRRLNTNDSPEIASDSRFSVRETIDFFECTRYADVAESSTSATTTSASSPTPKVRKNVLTKEKLLGSEPT